MATVTNEISLIDSMSPVMKNVIASLKSTITLMHDVSKASTSDFAKAEMAIQDAANAMDKYEKETAEAKNKQNQLNNSLGKGQAAFGGLLGSMKGLIAGYVGIQSVKGFVGWSDEMTQTGARLSMVNDGLQSNAELQEMIYQSAQNSRSAYGQTADVVAKLGLRAGDIFKSNKETVRFSETLNKMFGIAGATQQEQHSASLQLIQALGSGVLRGEEFNAVFEAAPNVMQAVAKSMGKPIGELRNLATEGKITAETVKNAILKASIDVDKQFALMPMTWSQIWTKTVNYIQKEAWPLQQEFSKFLNSTEFKKNINEITKKTVEWIKTFMKGISFAMAHFNELISILKIAISLFVLTKIAAGLAAANAKRLAIAQKMLASGFIDAGAAGSRAFADIGGAIGKTRLAVNLLGKAMGANLPLLAAYSVYKAGSAVNGVLKERVDHNEIMKGLKESQNYATLMLNQSKQLKAARAAGNTEEVARLSALMQKQRDIWLGMGGKGEDPGPLGEEDGMSEEMRKFLESIKDSGKQTAKNTEKFKLDERGLALLTEYAKNEWNRTYNTMRNSTKISFNGPIHQSTDVRAIAKEVEGMMLDSYTSLVGA